MKSLKQFYCIYIYIYILVMAFSFPAVSMAEATVLKGDGCPGVFIVRDGNNQPVPDSDLTFVLVSTDRMTHIICRGQVTPSNDGRAVQFDLNPECHETVSASGQATVVCLEKL